MVRQLSVRLKSATISVVTRPTTFVLLGSHFRIEEMVASSFCLFPCIRGLESYVVATVVVVECSGKIDLLSTVRVF